jgi:aminopeptidase
MIDSYAERMATVLTNYSIPIQKNDLVVINGSIDSAPLIDALQTAVLKRGGHPHIDVGLPNSTEILLANGNDEQLAYSDPISMTAVEKMDVIFRIYSPTNTRGLSSVPSEKLAVVQEGNRKWAEVYRRRREAEEIRWCVAPWPTMALAQEAEMGLYAYRQFVYEACGLDQDDPVAYWQQFRDRQTGYVNWLKGKNHVVVKGPGIDLELDITDRTWISAHGEVNFPDGEIFTGPVENSVNGVVEFNYPTVYNAQEVNGVRLEFKDGKVVKASAKKGEDYLQKQLDMDDGARFLGEFAIGTNTGIQQFTRNTLFDEKIGGTIHMALGQSYAETGGKNKSLVHWDMVHGMTDGGEIKVDGEVIYRNGDFVIS